mgnify:CR=1 FL=1
MKCPKCGSENVTVQLVGKPMEKKKHGVWWWVLVGWWWVPLKWIGFFGVAIVMKIVSIVGHKVKNEQIARCVCNDCAYVWDADEQRE